MIKAVIFDMDGVIINSEPLHKEAFQKMFKEFNLKVSNKLYGSFSGGLAWQRARECERWDDIRPQPNLPECTLHEGLVSSTAAL